jgi:tRNA pseudouridine32 synthase / 23S rRNA pseudouridine746 synthase
MLLADRVLFIDAEALVVDKPAGLPVDRPRDGTLSVENHLDSLRFGFERRPVAAHRLDRDTSGCLLLARNPRALTRYNRAFEEGRVEKIYLAVVEGIPAEADGVVDLPLTKVSSAADGWRVVVEKRGKSARTHWQVAGFANGRALIRFRPETGRTHQLRVHAASGIGMPIVGDPVYGSGGPHMMLHAAALTVPRENHPPIAVTAPLPPHFVEAGFRDE